MLAGLAAGLVDAMAGGGGLIVLPALLSTGMAPHLALGTNKLAGTFGTLTATLTFFRHQVLQPSLWTAAALATFTGALLGALCAWLLAADWLDKFIPMMVMAAAIYVGLYQPRRIPAPQPHGRPAGAKSLLLGSGLGFYDGFFGPGAGAFWVALLTRMFHLDTLTASGVARFMNLISNTVSLATFMALSLVHYPTGLAVGLCIMLGAWVGARTAIRMGSMWLRRVFLLIVFGMSLRLAWQAWMT